MKKAQYQPIKFVYIHSMAFPCNEANAFDAVWTASALADKADTTLFIRKSKVAINDLKEFYYVQKTKLHIRSMHMNLIPDRVILKVRHFYEKLISLMLRFHPKWAFFTGTRVMYIRDPKIMQYFGQLREKQTWLKKWILVYESHDPFGLDPHDFIGQNPFKAEDMNLRKQRLEVLKAAKKFDAIICNTHALADDLREWSDNQINPFVIKLASPLPRLDHEPIISFGDKVRLGYIGTIDKFRGVDILIEALRFLPDKYSLYLVGKVRQEQGVNPNWINEALSEFKISERIELRITDHMDDVAVEIDKCDILVQTASENLLDSRYATPQKTFGYMVRGKPILAADVPCHHELFCDEKNAILYHLSPDQLAIKVEYLVNKPGLATQIAVGAWKQSEDYTFNRRVNDIFAVIDHIK